MKIEFHGGEIKDMGQYARLLLGIATEAKKEGIEEINLMYVYIPIEQKTKR